VIPQDLVVDAEGLRVASPALSILDLIPSLGGMVIDEGLRRRAVRLPDLQHALALTPGRAHNRLRSTLLHDSRDEPWSEAERSTHRLLRAAKLDGWRTNHRVVANGMQFVVDIVFLRQRVIIEIDGWKFHRGRDAFTQDRWRFARLAAAGWTVLPFAATAVEDDPDHFLEVVRTALSRAR